jgi:hypothetical protein
VPRLAAKALLTLLLIAMLGGRCVLCYANPGTAQSHHCCPKDKRPAQTPATGDACQGSSFEVQDVAFQATPLVVLDRLSVDLTEVLRFSHAPVFIAVAEDPPDSPRTYSPVLLI